jgi:tRNA A22 N-methylase
MTPEEEAAAAARAEEQIRQRKARREAKIKAGAESRLKTITGLGGGVQRGELCCFQPSSSPSMDCG